VSAASIIAASVIGAALAIAPGRAFAGVERYAVVVGNNQGRPGDGRLSHAETDATRMAQVLRDLGGFTAEEILVLNGEGAAEVRRALIQLNARIRQRTSEADTMLFVYYSGHADASALHLGGTSMSTRELDALVRGSPARLRVLVVDSCRSGALTRGKGGQVAPAIRVVVDERLPGEGMVVLSASAANEDAQESDEVSGSFFTHFLISGLVGAADADGDGAVTVQEAYRHAYAETLRATSETLLLQHPSYRYDVRGRGDFVLTRPGTSLGAGRALVQVPPGRDYLLFAREGAQPVVEISRHAASRTLNLRAGTYFVRARDRSYLLEGSVEAAAGHLLILRDGLLRRVEYARLVRKGGHELRRAHSLGVGMRGASPLVDGGSPCLGGYAGYAADFPRFRLGARLGACRAGHDNDALRADDDEIALELAAGHAWDVGALTIDLGASAGGGVLRQSFERAGAARLDPRTSAVGLVGAHVGLELGLTAGFFGRLEAASQTRAFRQEMPAGSEPEMAWRTGLRLDLGVGRYF